MIRIILLNFMCVLIAFEAQAQVSKTNGAAKENITQLSFLIGTWQGTGWRLGRNGKKTFQQTELVQFKLDSTAVLIEGKGKSGGRVIHNALAVINYDKQNKNYNFQSYLANGRSGNFRAALKEGEFYWFMNDTLRFIITIDKQGRWIETGEMKRNGKWSQFFAMTLKKVSS